MSESRNVRRALNNADRLNALRDKYYAGDMDWDKVVEKIVAIMLTSAGIQGSEEVRKFRARVMAINFLEPGADYIC